jgi:hypothetical protein
MKNNFWALRQNYAEKTNQEEMKELILSQKFITCPWGGWGKERENVVNEVYNKVPCREGGRSALNQDFKFVEEMKIGDIVVIPFTKQADCIVARVIGDVEYAFNTGLYYRGVNDSQIRLQKDGDLPFRPVGRRIEIIRTDYRPKRRLGQQTLSKLNEENIQIL